MFVRRGRRPDNPRVLVVRVGLFFLAAGVWLVGVIIDDLRLTGVAILLLFAAILLGLLSRRPTPEDDSLEEDLPVDEETQPPGD